MDNNHEAQTGDEPVDTTGSIDPVTSVDAVEVAEESAEESTLRWLLEMDMSDPEEKLFAVDPDENMSIDLTSAELDVANRPMMRGMLGADDFENYIKEEIVIESVEQASDIYAGDAPSQHGNEARDAEISPEIMAVDFSRPTTVSGVGSAPVVGEGVDILGLSEDDDMGEKFLVLKRVKPTVEKPAASSSVSPQPPVNAAEDVEGDCDNGENNAHDEIRSQQPADEGYLQSPLTLSEAPVLKLVGQAAGVSVANDVPDSEAAVAKDGSVMDYVAEVPAPADDHGFDQYLLGGEQLSEGATDFSGLDLEGGDEGMAFDVTPDEAIEYHADFQQLAGFGEETVAGITPLVPLLMEQVSAAVTARLETLGLPTDAVQAELMLEANSAQVQQMSADGFEPVLAICSQAPDALQQLGQQQIDAIYLRLLHPESGECWNRLFSEGFTLPGSMAPDAPLETTEPELELLPMESTAPEADAFESFGGDALDDDSLDEIMGAGWPHGEDEIDDIFADFKDDTAELSDTESALATLGLEGDDSVEQAEILEVFGEDIFAEEISAELEVPAVSEPSDIDALFESLGQTPADDGEICGLDVDEFDAATEDDAGEPDLSLSAADEVEAEPEIIVPEPAAGSGQAWCVPEGIAFSESSPSSGEIFPDFLDAFIEEGSSELEKLEDAVAAWERDLSSEPAYAVVGRILHTVKGIAKGVGLHSYGTLIHNYETLLGSMARPEAGAEVEYFRVVNVWLDAAVRGLEHIRENRTDITHVLPQVAGASDAPVVEESGTPEPEGNIAPAQAAPAPVPQMSAAKKKQKSQKLADDGARALAAQQSVRITSEKLDQMLNLANQAQQLGVRTSQGAARSKRAAAEMHSRLASVRAHIAGIADRALRSVAHHGGQRDSELDALEMDQYSELQEAANILREGVEDLADLVEFASRQNVQVEALLKQQANVISSIGSSIRSARVVPVSRLIPGLRRLVRTVSVDLNKTVSLQVLNELGTLDRDDYARCQTILEHMMRNALDHGIEPEQERIAAGKPAVGKVSIDIRKAGADAIIVLSDDGRGIDPEAMRESAARKGLDIDVDALSDDEAVRLIFHKGFSTANTVSQISGRGVGMDIVLTELQEMGGDIRIETEAGSGTSFHIRVPSSITVNGALMVRAAEHSYAIPLAGLVAVEYVSTKDFFAAVESGDKLSIAGWDCEPAYLGALLHTGEFPDAKAWRDSVPVIIAGSAERYMAIAIDGVEEALEMVIRSLGTQFASVPGVAGAATTAAGEAIVALDLNMLVASVDEDQHSNIQVHQSEAEGLLAMVVDDSRTQRMVATSQLETVGVETITAENGGVAIDLLNTADRLPDIILLDVEMPVKDGIQTLREIRKSVRYSHIPVIMITSRTGLKHRTLAQDAGCNGYMGKPFNFRMLVGQINELTGHRLNLS